MPLGNELAGDKREEFQAVMERIEDADRLSPPEPVRVGDFGKPYRLSS